MREQTRRMTRAAMLCAMAYAAVAIGRVPVVLFLKYDPKDIVIALGGLLWGPQMAAGVSAVVPLLEMATVSSTGLLGCGMNILSTCSFACTAAAIYQKRRTPAGAALGLAAGAAGMTAAMLLWNYLVTPLYMGYPRAAVAELLVPVFLPFNLLKAALNGAGTFLLLRPVEKALRRAQRDEALPPSAPPQRTLLPALAAGAVLLTGLLLLAVWRGLL